MGSGMYSDHDYHARASLRAATSTPVFAYSASVTAKPRSAWKAHTLVDPKTENKGGVFAGKNIREARDSADHPESLPIFVAFDVTGSMDSVPRIIQQKLPDLMGLLLRKGYVSHPQIAVAAFGDAAADTMPLQVSPFESDVRIDDHLNNLVLEGGGGGQMCESPSLAMYFLAKLTATDSWEKRQKKGYAFFITDEMSWPARAKEIRDYTGQIEQADWSIEECIKAVQEKWELFVITPNMTSHYGASWLVNYWQKLLGERYIQLDEPEAIAEFIATQVCLCESAIADEALDEDLAKLPDPSAKAVKKALRKPGGVPAKVPDSGAPSGVATL